MEESRKFGTVSLRSMMNKKDRRMKQGTEIGESQWLRMTQIVVEVIHCH